MSDDERGSSMIEIRLDYVTAAEVEDLAERFADVLVEGGFGDNKEDLKSIIAVRPYEWPEEPEDLVRELSSHSIIVIPTKSDED